jgi:hypothetical protein
MSGKAVPKAMNGSGFFETYLILVFFEDITNASIINRLARITAWKEPFTWAVFLPILA